MHRLVLLAAFVASSAFFAHAQSLGEIAKKAAEQREDKKDSQPTKVYTNKDLKEEPPSPITPASSTVTSSAPSTSASPTAAPAVPPPADYRQVSMKDEAYWKGRMQAAQSALDTDSIHHAAMATTKNQPPQRCQCHDKAQHAPQTVNWSGIGRGCQAG